MVLLLLACITADRQIPTATATQGDFEVRLSVNGELDAKESKPIITPEFDSRAEIGWMAEEGSVVAEGDKLVEFDTAQMLSELETAETELELARTKILQERAKLELSLSDARNTIKKAELDLELAQMRRTDSDTVPLVEREAAKVAETKARMAIDTAKANLETVRLESQAETQVQQLTIDQNQRRVDTLRKQLENAVLTAPAAGIVIVETKWDGTKWQVGSSPWTGVPLMKLPELATMQVVAWVHEVDSPRIRKGQQATITMDAHPDAPVAGSIAKVADLAVARGEDEVKYLEIEVALDHTEPTMKPGMTVRVDLLLETVPDVVSIPIEAVFEDEDERSFVYTRGLTGWSQAPIELGTENDTHVVVTSGIEAGTEIALVAPNTKEGRPAGEEDR